MWQELGELGSQAQTVREVQESILGCPEEGEGVQVRLFCYWGYTELGRLGLGVEFIGGGGKYGLVVTILWWFVMPGLEKVRG